jgi:hypothetical protein
LDYDYVLNVSGGFASSTTIVFRRTSSPQYDLFVDLGNKPRLLLRSHSVADMIPEVIGRLMGLADTLAAIVTPLYGALTFLGLVPIRA